MTVTEAVERYLDAQASRGAAANTLKSYDHDLRHFAKAVLAELAAVDADAIRGFLHDDGRLSPATRQRRFATLSSFYRWLYRHDLVPVNLMGRVDRIDVPRREPRPLSPDVVTAVLKAIPSTATRDRALFTLLYETGMRVGEALGVAVADLDLTQDDEQIRVMGKGNRERTVLLTAARESIRLLRRHLKVSGITSDQINAALLTILAA